ncbi:RNA-directed DNA polymerase from mobile element jockey [Eumeta japonica]|uniref:RNA-directed DNA polymerase from mobile element jockey n=1 Tax=Eumeta variegata TaxID=151549 RepID=A0A4C1VFZ2_EUMVA|nr:RNA-directed DNA polymerase from mobile element jockey [Eumeta japonica]
MVEQLLPEHLKFLMLYALVAYRSSRIHSILETSRSGKSKGRKREELTLLCDVVFTLGGYRGFKYDCASVSFAITVVSDFASSAVINVSVVTTTIQTPQTSQVRTKNRRPVASSSAAHRHFEKPLPDIPLPSCLWMCEYASIPNGWCRWRTCVGHGGIADRGGGRRIREPREISDIVYVTVIEPIEYTQHDTTSQTCRVPLELSVSHHQQNRFCILKTEVIRNILTKVAPNIKSEVQQDLQAPRKDPPTNSAPSTSPSEKIKALMSVISIIDIGEIVLLANKFKAAANPVEKESTKKFSASVLGEDISTIMSILQVVRSAEVSDLAAKFRKMKHGVDRLKIILDKQDLINWNGREMEALCESLHFDIVTPLTPTYYPNNINYRPDILDIALKLSCIELLQWLNSDHRPVLMTLSSLIADSPPLTKTITNWQKVSAALEEIGTPILNSIPNDIVSTDDIDNMIGVLTNHIRTVIESSCRTVPAKFDRKVLPGDVIELIRDKNAALRRAGKYPTCENRFRARTLQHEVKARMNEVKNDNWSESEILPSHKAYWGPARALKTEGAVPTPALKRPYEFIAFDDREKAECLADSIEHQCSDNSPYDLEHIRRVEEEVRHRVSLPPKDDLDPITYDKVRKHIKGLKIRKAPGRDTISSKAIKCFSAPLVALLVAILNAFIQNCYFPAAWKEAVVIGILKPGKPRDLPAT